MDNGESIADQPNGIDRKGIFVPLSANSP